MQAKGVNNMHWPKAKHFQIQVSNIIKVFTIPCVSQNSF